MIRSLLFGGLLAVVLLAQAPVSAFALSSNLLSWSSWHTYGDVAVDIYDKTITLDENEDETQYAYQDIDVDDYSSDYVAIAAFTRVDDMPADGITGVPEMYAYVYDHDGDRIATLSASTLTHDDDNSDDEWDVTYGIFSLTSSADRLRLYVTQEEDDENDKRGVDADVYKIAVHGAESRSEADQFVDDNYWDRLSDLNGTSDNDDNNNDDDNDDNDNDSDDDWVPTCTSGRSVHYINVHVTSLPYTDDEDENTDSEIWALWVANQDAWIWGDWGTGNALAYSTGNYAEGYICAKSGDELRINGIFDDDTKYLVYRTSTGGYSTQITSVWGDNGHEAFTDDQCWIESNGMNGYDMVCEVDYEIAID